MKTTFNKLSTYLAKKQIKPLSGNVPSSNFESWETTKKIGILYFADSTNTIDVAKKWARTLKNENKDIILCGFINNKDKNLHGTALLGDIQFNRKDLKINLAPKIEPVDYFMKQPLDVLFYINADTILPLELIARKSPANCKVAMENNKNDFCHLLISVAKNQTNSALTDQFLQNSIKYLNKINNSVAYAH